RYDHPRNLHFPYTTLFRSLVEDADLLRPYREPPPVPLEQVRDADEAGDERGRGMLVHFGGGAHLLDPAAAEDGDPVTHGQRLLLDRKSTRLNSSHVKISYA